MGLDIARERHGFDYSDQAAVIAQNEAMMRDVIRLKDHPALLMWGLGNELNLRAKNDSVWDAMEDWLFASNRSTLIILSPPCLQASMSPP